MSIWMSNRQLKFKMSQTRPLVYHPKLAALKPFPLSVDSNSIHPVAQAKNLVIILTALFLLYSTSRLLGRLLAQLSKDDQNPDRSLPTCYLPGPNHHHLLQDLCTRFSLLSLFPSLFYYSLFKYSNQSLSPHLSQIRSLLCSAPTNGLPFSSEKKAGPCSGP